MTANHKTVTIFVDDEWAFDHRSVGPDHDDHGAVELAMNVFLMGRDRSELVGKKVHATVTPDAS